MKINNHKTYLAVVYGDKLPRKAKKSLLGKRLSSSKLRRMIKGVTVGKQSETMYEAEILPNAFCPNCGCTEMHGSGNMATYPEHWEIFKCDRCNSPVAYIDNSPFRHILEDPEYFDHPYFK